MPHFSLLIRNWYRQNKRPLPWRSTNDPYHIWLSEIIMQQTRVEQGSAYYEKFITNYPTVTDLAQASEQEILNDWQGLGYYSRARNLHFSAKLIVNDHNSIFPQTFDEIIKLKGVGTYTASAIASFAFGEPKAVVDGNVYRFLSRAFNINTPIDSTQGQKDFQLLADSLISHEAPGEHNQAMMEIGALVCTPHQPDCLNCPVHDICEGRAKNTFSDLPVKSKKTKVRNRFFHYLIYLENGNTLIEQRTKKDIWQHMYQFPLIECSNENDLPNLPPFKLRESEVVVHKLSHQNIHTVFHIFDKLPKVTNEFQIKIPIDAIQDYPLPRIIDRYLEENPFDV